MAGCPRPSRGAQWTPAVGCRALRCQAVLADRSEMRQSYWPMAKCGLLLPLLAIALPTPPPSVAGTVAIALLCDTDDTHKSSLLYWPHTWAHSTRREGTATRGRGAQIRSRGTCPSTRRLLESVSTTTCAPNSLVDLHRRGGRRSTRSTTRMTVTSTTCCRTPTSRRRSRSTTARSAGTPTRRCRGTLTTR